MFGDAEPAAEASDGDVAFGGGRIVEGHGAPPEPPSGPDGLLEPTFHDLPHVDTPPTPEVQAARSAAMSHWVDDDGLLAPDNAIGELEAASHGDGLIGIEAAAARKKQELQARVDDQSAKLDERGTASELDTKAKIEQEHPKADDIRAGQPARKGPSQPSHVKPAQQCGPVTKSDLVAKVETATATELAKLEADFEKEKAQLDTRFGAQLGSLDAEQQKQTARVAGRIEHGDADLALDIQHRKQAHDKQIGGEQKTIDAEAGKQIARVDAQGASDAAAAVAEAQRQAELTRQNGLQRVDEVRGSARINAVNARSEGTLVGGQALAAAQAQHVQAMGEQRRTMAIGEADTRAKAIEAKGDTASHGLANRAASDALKQLDTGSAMAAQARTNAISGSSTIKEEGFAAHRAMQAVSDGAVAKMTAARLGADLQGGAQAATAGATMSAAQADARKTADTEKADAVGKLQQTFDAQKAKIESKRQAELQKIASAKEADLCHLEKQVDGDLVALSKLADEADTRMKAQVKRAEQKLKKTVLQQKQKMRAAAVKALCAIDRFVAQAKKGIRSADKDTHKAIAEAGKAGRKAVVDAGPAAVASVASANKLDRDLMVQTAEADRASLDKQATGVEAELTKDAEATGGAIRDRMVKEALADVSGDLTRKHVWSYISDAQATHATDTLTSLPKDLQGKAIADMPKEQFQNLLSEVPQQKKEDFETLVQNTTDPDRKLQLWAAFAKAKAHDDADRMKGDTGHWYWRNDAQKKAKEQNDRRQNIADTTDKEVDEEVAHLRDLEKKGTPLTKEAVDELYQRKKLENDIEMKYAVNITNDVDGGKIDDSDNAPTQRRVWSKPELEELQAVMSRLPQEHRDRLKTIRRSGVSQDWNDSTKKWQTGTAAAYMTQDGEMRFFDSGTSGNMRHTGEKDFANQNVSTIKENFVHELGHNVENTLRSQGKGDVVDRFYKAAGWENLSEAQVRARLKAQGMSDADINTQMQSFANDRPGGVPNPYYNRNPYTGKDGKIYEVDPYSGNFLAVNQNAFPDKFNGGTATQDTHWQYARSNPQDHFAESYMQAVHVPEQFYQDLVGEPTRARDNAQTQLTAAQDAVNTATTADEKRLAQDQLKKAQQNLDQAKATMDARGQEFSIMRNEVFHTDTADADSKKHLEGVATSPANAAKRDEIMKQYSEEAAHMATPEQVKALEDKYRPQLEALK